MSRVNYVSYTWLALRRVGSLLRRVAWARLGVAWAFWVACGNRSITCSVVFFTIF